MGKESSGPHRVAMLIYPGVAPLDVAGPLQVFGVCNFLRGAPLYAVTTVAPTAAPVGSRIGITMLPDCAMDALELPVDTLLVAGGGGPEAGATEEIGRWLRHAAPQAGRFGSICTGAFALAAAGLVDGRRVATHWAFADRLAERTPGAVVDADAIYVRDGDLWTSAGITSGIDLALAMIEEDHGRPLALDVARYLVLHLKRTGGQTQFSSQLRAQFSDVPAVQRAQQWCLDNLDKPITPDLMAREAGMSGRSFARHFRLATGQTPAAFVASARVERATGLIGESSDSLADIARRCGFGSVASMRRAFAGTLGLTPGEYRTKFRLRPKA